MKLTHVIATVIGVIGIIGLRLLPHPPNMEPIMGSMMPFAKRCGWLFSAIISFVSIFLYDVISGTLGLWSYATAITYALLGVAAGVYFKSIEGGVLHYVGFAIVGTLLYDIVTGVFLGPVLFGGMTYAEAFMGQIPFTLWHVLGNILLAATLSPAIEFVLSRTMPALKSEDRRAQA
jgi:hypothetical protein